MEIMDEWSVKKLMITNLSMKWQIHILTSENGGFTF